MSAAIGPIEAHAAEAASLIAAAAAAAGSTETLGLDALHDDPALGRGRLLAETVTAPHGLPGFDNSQMDGFAVRAGELAGATPAAPVVLPVGPAVPAGHPAPALLPGTAIPVMTGAPIPPGADAVVPVEAVTPPRFDVAEIAVSAAPSPGAFIRPKGADLPAGAVVAAAGTALTPAHWAALAAVGVAEVPLRRRLRVLAIPTGAELRPPGSDLGPGRIHDAGTTLLARLLDDAGAEAELAPCHSDDPEAFAGILGRRLHEADLVVTMGGASAGAYEVVRQVLEPAGVRFGPLPLQPGGPQGIGALPRPGWTPALQQNPVVPVLCLPGNPVSTLISFELFLREPLRRAAGLAPAARRRERAVLAEAADSPVAKRQLRRVIVEAVGSGGSDGAEVGGGITGGGSTGDRSMGDRSMGDRVLPIARFSGGPGSHLLAHYAEANGLAVIPEGIARLEAGAEVEVIRIDE